MTETWGSNAVTQVKCLAQRLAHGASNRKVTEPCCCSRSQIPNTCDSSPRRSGGAERRSASPAPGSLSSPRMRGACDQVRFGHPRLWGTAGCGLGGGGGRRAAQWLPNPGKDGLGRACGTETDPDGGSGFLRTRTPVPREAHLPPTSLPHPPPVSDTNQRQSDSVFLTPESSDPRTLNSLSQWILPRQRPEGPSLLSGRPSCLGPYILEIPGIPHVCPSRANDTGLMPVGCHPRIPNDGILFPLRTAGQVRPPAAATAAFLLLLPRQMCHSQ